MNVGGTGHPFNVYGGVLILPWWQMLGERRMGQLDFNMLNHFDLKLDKLQQEHMYWGSELGGGGASLAESYLICSIWLA